MSAENDPWSFEAWFEQGRLLSVTTPPTIGLDALEAAAYLFPAGTYRISDGPPAGDHNIDLSPAELARCLDQFDRQRAELSRSVPSLWAVPILTREPPNLTIASPGSDELDCLRAIDGKRTVAELLGTQRPLIRLRALASLVVNGSVTFDPSSTSTSPWTDRRPQSVTPDAHQDGGQPVTLPAQSTSP